MVSGSAVATVQSVPGHPPKDLGGKLGTALIDQKTPRRAAPHGFLGFVCGGYSRRSSTQTQREGVRLPSG